MRYQIEFPSRGATYEFQKWGVYKYDIYPPDSIMAGQTRREFVAAYETRAEAQAKHPDALLLKGSGFILGRE